MPRVIREYFVVPGGSEQVNVEAGIVGTLVGLSERIEIGLSEEIDIGKGETDVGEEIGLSVGQGEGTGVGQGDGKEDDNKGFNDNTGLG